MACGVNDSACAVLLAGEPLASRHGLTLRAGIVGVGSANEPDETQLGPNSACAGTTHPGDAEVDQQATRSPASASGDAHRFVNSSLFVDDTGCVVNETYKLLISLTFFWPRHSHSIVNKRAVFIGKSWRFCTANSPDTDIPTVAATSMKAIFLMTTGVEAYILLGFEAPSAVYWLR